MVPLFAHSGFQVRRDGSLRRESESGGAQVLSESHNEERGAGYVCLRIVSKRTGLKGTKAAAKAKKREDRKRELEDERSFLELKQSAQEALVARKEKEERDAQKKKDDREFEEKQLGFSVVETKAKMLVLEEDIQKDDERPTMLSQVEYPHLGTKSVAPWMVPGGLANPIDVDLPDVWAPVIEEVTSFVEAMLEDNRKLSWMGNLDDKGEMMGEIVQVMRKYAVPKGTSGLGYFGDRSDGDLR